MKYEIELIVSMILSVCYSLVQKKIEIDIIILSFVSAISIFLPILLKNIYSYKKDKSAFDVKENDLELTNNPIKNIFQKDSLKLGIYDTIICFGLLYSLKKLPANFALPMGLLWMVFALFFNYYVRGVIITKDDIIGLVLVIIGLLIMQYEKIFKQFTFENKFIIPIFVLLFTQILYGYFVTFLKQYEDKITVDHLQLITQSNCLFIMIIIFIIYMTNPTNSWKIKYPKKFDVVKLALSGATFGYFKQELKFESQKNLSQNYYTVLSSFRIIVTLLLCWLFMGEKISIYNAVGAVIVIFGLLFKNIEQKVTTNLYHNLN